MLAWVCLNLIVTLVRGCGFDGGYVVVSDVGLVFIIW